MSVEVSYRATCSVVETLEANTDSASAANRAVTHNQFDETATLNSTSTPPATKCAFFIQTLTVGAATINLTALTGANGATVVGTGLKLQVIRIKNLGANPMTFVEGASNGYAIGWGTGLTVPAGGHVMQFFNDTLPDVATADTTIDVSGTGSQTAEITIILG